MCVYNSQSRRYGEANRLLVLPTGEPLREKRFRSTTLYNVPHSKATVLKERGMVMYCALSNE